MVDDPAAALAGGERWQRYMDAYVDRTRTANHSVYTEDSAELQRLDADNGAAMRARWFGGYEGCRITGFEVDGISRDERDVYVRFRVTTQVKPIPGLQTKVMSVTERDGWNPPVVDWQVYRLRSDHGTLRLVDSASVNPPHPGSAD
jgi:hypothetical protein